MHIAPGGATPDWDSPIRIWNKDGYDTRDGSFFVIGEAITEETELLTSNATILRTEKGTTLWGYRDLDLDGDEEFYGWGTDGHWVLEGP